MSHDTDTADTDTDITADRLSVPNELPNLCTYFCIPVTPPVPRTRGINVVLRIMMDYILPFLVLPRVREDEVRANQSIRGQGYMGIEVYINTKMECGEKGSRGQAT